MGIKRKKPIEPLVYKTRIKVIGIGGGGSSIVSEIALEVKNASFVAVNTDRQALKEVSGKVKRFQLGQKLTHGLGTGMNPALGEQVARDEKEKIKKLLEEQDFCILISCLGGGTGTGASPVFAEISNELKNITLGIFILPFEFEGKKKMGIAHASLEKLKPNLNALVIIPNEKIFQIIDKKTPLKDAFSAINKFLAEGLEGLIGMIYHSGLINIDFADLKTVLEGRGALAYLNAVEMKSSSQIEDVAGKILSNPLYPYSPQEAAGVLFNIDGGLNLSMQEIEEIGKTISNFIRPQGRVAFGVTRGQPGKIKITLLANGCKWDKWEIELPKAPQPETLKSSEEEKPKKVKKPSQKFKPGKKVKIKVKQPVLDLNEIFQKEEKKMLAKERKFDIPAFLRRKSS